ncbi:putative 5-3 exonuclease [Basidiobolus meristosporus CBS 931.73]|uniref:Putative 5-3 exonuclease n=1 Tax=Basidiobolus meristosporus CBS 931.73 TaxID=1314790 RepID=A0A1Y1Y0N8_9FUNG|nr:putative 5-3 exonuclease [Basidiobolus meristosporus CBS 931.73]|eukprot:ORX91560.1 putative 5-3 exonuclease [Basidiobolus meristosporus CBS 931.73]
MTHSTLSKDILTAFFETNSQKYPQCFQHVNENRVCNYLKNIDNLYVDLNGIIHSSCQARLAAPKTKFSEETVFGAVTSYLAYLVKRIKPKKLLFVAIDGVSPRAKLNQQRARRFSSVQSLARNSKNTRAFDTNSITPGTEFMNDLSSHLEDFVRRQVSKDADWQKLQVLVSNHEVPGEGEHKILEFLRNASESSDYSPDHRHCLYGSDSDLIILGLLSHEPNFVVMKEKLTPSRVGSKNRR